MKYTVTLTLPEPLAVNEEDQIRRGTAAIKADIAELNARRTGSIATVDANKMYTPGEVAKLLAVSYDTAVRRMKTMPGCVDLGSKEKRHKRPKAKLRISGKHLTIYLKSKSQ